VRIIARPAFRNRHRNPYNWLLYSHVQALGVDVQEFSDAGALTRDDAVLHLHWPEARMAVESARSAVKQIVAQQHAIERARRLGIKIVWTAHNLSSHEQGHPWLEHLFWKAFIPRIHGFISLSAAGRASAIARYPRLGRIPGFVIPHGHYRDVYPNTISRAEARDRLGISHDATVLGFVGLIRSYKHVPQLLSTFRQLHDQDAVLLVAGRVMWPETVEGIRSTAGADPRIRLHLDFVPDDDIQIYLNAADLVVLPFREILNSGSALLALSFDRPVLVPRAGSIEDLRRETGDDWVRTYEGELSIDDLRGAVRWAQAPRKPLRPCLDRHSWSEIASRTVEAYRTLTSH
jgi:beta-1,4-mannosyltransferase